MDEQENVNAVQEDAAGEQGAADGNESENDNGNGNENERLADLKKREDAIIEREKVLAKQLLIAEGRNILENRGVSGELAECLCFGRMESEGITIVQLANEFADIFNGVVAEHINLRLNRNKPFPDSAAIRLEGDRNIIMKVLGV